MNSLQTLDLLPEEVAVVCVKQLEATKIDNNILWGSLSGKNWHAPSFINSFEYD